MANRYPNKSLRAKLVTIPEKDLKDALSHA